MISSGQESRKRCREGERAIDRENHLPQNEGEKERLIKEWRISETKEGRKSWKKHEKQGRA